jgi:hypothetical protein
MRQFVQGDILFVEVKNPAKIIERKREDSKVVARGEKTGHAHVIDGNGFLFLGNEKQETGPIGDTMDALTTQWISMGQSVANFTRRFLRAETDLKVRHDEHGAVDLPAGTWEVIQQQTFDYEKAARERVVD